MNNGTSVSNSSECIGCPCHEIQQAWENYHAWYQTIICCIGVIANVLILATLLAARISHSCHVYVLALTLADLVYCLCRLAIYHYSRLPQGVMELWLCRALFTAYNVGRGFGNWLMVLLAADRLRVVASPLRTHAKGRRTQFAVACTGALCVTVLAVNLPRFFYTVQFRDVYYQGKWYMPYCYLLLTDLSLALRGAELALTIHVPVVANAVINIVLCYCIWDMRKRRRRLSQVPSSVRRSRQATSSTDDAERQLTQMLLATSIMHSVFSLPIACLEAVNLKQAFVRTNDYFLYLCINYGLSLFYSWQVFINLPIYLLYNTAFKQQFLRLLLPCCFRGGNDGGLHSRKNVPTVASSVSETNM
ncbi:hypothetical protein BOX15_Mlig025190g1 [Macrostomum lignano]|uniref:G-protein coupled receptors family 1 profile domain-containing protein n=1 Tax=Macrostomum lignano TaxID=282301 RepID=A0A267FME0_9PLAT|nr:hypothetical protein BOX15_Mlig025190g1 [Macrostomum lignano]